MTNTVIYLETLKETRPTVYEQIKAMTSNQDTAVKLEQLFYSKDSTAVADLMELILKYFKSIIRRQPSLQKFRNLEVDDILQSVAITVLRMKAGELSYSTQFAIYFQLLKVIQFEISAITSTAVTFDSNDCIIKGNKYFDFSIDALTVDEVTNVSDVTADTAFTNAVNDIDNVEALHLLLNRMPSKYQQYLEYVTGYYRCYHKLPSIRNSATAINKNKNTILKYNKVDEVRDYLQRLQY
jgi:hypothetical protein